MTDNGTHGGDSMGFGCCGGGGVDQVRNFLTREERIALLREYSDGLEKEVQGIKERIKELEEK
jgi:hypothetical protein